MFLLSSCDFITEFAIEGLHQCLRAKRKRSFLLAQNCTQCCPAQLSPPRAGEPFWPPEHLARHCTWRQPLKLSETISELSHEKVTAVSCSTNISRAQRLVLKRSPCTQQFLYRTAYLLESTILAIAQLHEMPFSLHVPYK